MKYSLLNSIKKREVFHLLWNTIKTSYKIVWLTKTCAKLLIHFTIVYHTYTQSHLNWKFNMVWPIINDDWWGHYFKNIVKQVKQAGYNVSAATVRHIQHGKGDIRNNILKTGKSGCLANVAQLLLMTSYVKSVLL
jgi:hypothetical protein